MLIILRIVFALGLVYFIGKVQENARLNPENVDLINAGYLAVCVFMAILNAIVWAPFLGGKISDPITDALTTGTAIDQRNQVLRLIYWLQQRGHRRLTLCFCFLEGIRRPSFPGAFVIGFKNTRRGSWLEKIFAREVFRFSNTQNCLLAYEALKRHGVQPGPHPSPEVNLLLLALYKPAKPEPEIVNVPSAPQKMPLRRNPRIRLFEAAEPTPNPADTAAAPGPPLARHSRDVVEVDSPSGTGRS
jgi:hypothetical protein